MTEVNEEIVKQYLEVKGYFVRTDVKYRRSKEETGLKSSGWSDLDILAWSPTGEKTLIQVKGWHTESITPSHFKDGEWIDSLARREAEKILKDSNFKVILVVPEIGSRSREAVVGLAKKQGINEIWEFKPILDELVRHVQENINYSSEVLQTIRLLKAYGFLKQEQIDG